MIRKQGSMIAIGSLVTGFKPAFIHKNTGLLRCSTKKNLFLTVNVAVIRGSFFVQERLLLACLNRLT
jgi:hypothetical protein